MFSAKAFTLRVALIDAPDNLLQTLNGVMVRDMNVSWEHIPAPFIANDSWRRHAQGAEKHIRMRIEGMLQDTTAARYMRTGGIHGETLQMELTWPGLATSFGQFLVTNYQEYAEPDDVIAYRAELISSGTQILTPIS